jgi:hypothetical protein
LDESGKSCLIEFNGNDQHRLDLNSSGDIQFINNSGGVNYFGFDLNIKEKSVTTAKIADHAIGAHQTKACQDYTGDDAEIWVFNCGSATVNV